MHHMVNLTIQRATSLSTTMPICWVMCRYALWWGHIGECLVWPQPGREGGVFFLLGFFFFQPPPGRWPQRATPSLWTHTRAWPPPQGMPTHDTRYFTPYPYTYHIPYNLPHTQFTHIPQHIPHHIPTITTLPLISPTTTPRRAQARPFHLTNQRASAPLKEPSPCQSRKIE